MARYNNTSIFRTINLDDHSSLRRIVVCIYHELKSDSLTNEKCQLYQLTTLEIAWANRLLAAVYRLRNTGFQLLQHALYRYTHDDFTEDEVLIKATKELEDLAEEDELLIPEGHLLEYGKAHKRFADLVNQERWVCYASSTMFQHC